MAGQLTADVLRNHNARCQLSTICRSSPGIVQTLSGRLDQCLAVKFCELTHERSIPLYVLFAILLTSFLPCPASASQVQPVQAAVGTSRCPVDVNSAGLLVLHGSSAMVVAPRGTKLVLAPLRGENTATLKLLDGGQIVAVRNLSTGDSGTFEVSAQPPALRVLTIAALADDGATSTAMRCTIRLGRSAVSAPSITWADEQVHIAAGADAEATTAYAFIDGAYRGIVSLLDGHLPGSMLPAGKHLVALVPRSDDGRVWPPTVAPITVASRYDIRLAPSLARYIVPSNEDTSVSVTVTVRSGCGIASTMLVVAGRPIATVTGTEWTRSVPLRPVPSGEAAVECTGITDDGRVLPTESVTIVIQNDDYEQRLSFTPEYEIIRDEAAKAKKSDAEAASWLARAQAEPYWRDSDALASENYIAPNGVTFTTRAYASLRIVNPKLSEYLGNWAKAAAEAGQAYVAMGRLWLKLECRGRARNAFGRAITSSPANSATNAQARQAYEALIKATSGTPPAKPG